MDNIAREVRMEESASFKEMIRMSYETFLDILKAIEADTTPQQIVGENDVINAESRLMLTLSFLARGETYISLYFKFRFSRAAISNIVKQVSKPSQEICNKSI